MKASTIKIENPLLDQLYEARPDKKMSLSAFVRGILEADVRRRRGIEAADKYSEFLKSNPEEGEWLQDWESAPLGEEPRPSRKRKAA